MPAEFENRRIVFKFKDDFNLLATPAILKRFAGALPKGYEEQLEKFRTNSKLNTVILYADIEPRITALLEKIEQALGSPPSYVFQYTTVEVFNNLRNCLRQTVALRREQGIEAITGILHTAYRMPNLYLCFQYIVLESVDELVLMDCLKQLNAFSTSGKENDLFSIFDYVYLKQDAIEAEDNSLQGVVSTGGNQDYFGDLDIPLHSITDRDVAYHAQNSWLGIIEKFGWYVHHQEFDNMAGRYEVMMGQPTAQTNQLRINLTSADILNRHGTKNLGVLISQNYNSSPDCRGLLPSSTKLALSSTVMALNGARGWQTNNITHNAENAFLRVLDFYCSHRYGIQTVHVEIQTGEKLPMTSEPLFADLLELAYELGHTVVVPAGNGSNSDRLTVKLDALNSQVMNSTIFRRTIQKYILVGGAVKENRSFKVHLGSNWDSSLMRIFAQSENILTTSNSANGYDKSQNTSGASAIIAGIVGFLQAFARSKINRPLFPEELIRILSMSVAQEVKMGNSIVGIMPKVSEAMRRIERWPPNTPTS